MKLIARLPLASVNFYSRSFVLQALKGPSRDIFPMCNQHAIFSMFFLVYYLCRGPLSSQRLSFFLISTGIYVLNFPRFRVTSDINSKTLLLCVKCHICSIMDYSKSTWASKLVQNFTKSQWNASSMRYFFHFMMYILASK